MFFLRSVEARRTVSEKEPRRERGSWESVALMLLALLPRRLGEKRWRKEVGVEGRGVSCVGVLGREDVEGRCGLVFVVSTGRDRTYVTGGVWPFEADFKTPLGEPVRFLSLDTGFRTKGFGDGKGE